MKTALIFVVATALLLEGCASVVNTEWFAAPTHAALKPYYLEVSAQDLPKACLNAAPLRVLGCAVRMPVDHVCVIYTTPKPASFVLVHERKHCEGWDHA